MLALLLAVAPALAADPVGVLHAGDPVGATQAVAAALGSPEAAVDPVRLPGVRDGAGPRIVGGSGGGACTGAPTTNSSVRERVSRGEALYNSAEFEKALIEAKAAVGAVACLSEAVEASLAARAWVLLGVLHLELKDEAAGKADFRSAALFQPGGVVYDSRFRAAHRAVLDAAAAEVASSGVARLRIGPGGTGGLWVDGRAPTVANDEVALPPGQHLVQVLQPSVSTMVVTVAADDVVDLVRPAALSDGDVSLAADPRWQPWFTSALTGTGVGYVWSGGQLWKVGSEWESLPVHIRGVERSDAWAGILTGVGAGSAAVGITSLVLGYRAVGIHTGSGDLIEGKYYTSPDGETRAEEELRYQGYGGGEAMVTAGWVLSGVGTAVLVPGLVLVAKHW